MSLLSVVVVLIIVSKSFSLHHVLLVPGDLSSQLKARYTNTPPHPICGEQNKWFTLWLNLKYAIPYHPLFDCLVKTMFLNYNASSHTTSSPDYCQVIAPGFGTVDTIQYITQCHFKFTEYFASVIKELESKFGYIANKNIIGAPYDFRKGSNEMDAYLKNVKVLIEDMYGNSGGQPVIIIGHSMGCLHIVRLLNRESQQWKDKYVKTFISLSAPYSGSMKSVFGVITGYQTMIPYIKPQSLQPLLITWPSTYYLFPSPNTWSNNVIVTTKQGNFTARNLKKLLQISKVKNAVQHYEDNVRSIINIRAPNVTMHCIYSWNVSTVEKLNYDAIEFPLTYPNITYGDGDGTVNLESLKQCRAWKNDQEHHVDEAAVPNVDHFHILADRRVITMITDIIADLEKRKNEQ